MPCALLSVLFQLFLIIHNCRFRLAIVSTALATTNDTHPTLRNVSAASENQWALRRSQELKLTTMTRFRND